MYIKIRFLTIKVKWSDDKDDSECCEGLLTALTNFAKRKLVFNRFISRSQCVHAYTENR